MQTLSVLPVCAIAHLDAAPVAAGSARTRRARHVIWRARMARAARLAAALT